VGARGLGAMAGALIGSVSERVLHHAPCAVLCARQPQVP
jgi:nucleotide-binding universal stress UspA family protein